MRAKTIHQHIFLCIFSDFPIEIKMAVGSFFTIKTIPPALVVKLSRAPEMKIINISLLDLYLLNTLESIP